MVVDVLEERTDERAGSGGAASRRPLLLTFEGLCGSGKSSVAQQVTERLGAVHLPSIPSEFEPARQLVSSTPDVQARYLLYVAGLRQTSVLADRALAAGDAVVIDSYVHRTQAYHGAFGAQLVSVESFARRPDLTVFLDCPTDVRRARVARRGRTPDQWQVRAEGLVAEILARYARLPWPVVTVDATAALDDVVRQVLGLLSTSSPRPTVPTTTR